MEDSGRLFWSIQAAVKKHWRPGEWNNKHLFLIVPHAGASKIKALVDFVFGESLAHRGPSSVLLCWVFSWQEGQENFLGFLS